MLSLNDHETSHVDTDARIQEDQQHETLDSNGATDTLNILEVIDPLETISQPNSYPISEIEQLLGNNEDVQAQQENNEELQLPAEIVNELQLLMKKGGYSPNYCNTINQDDSLQKVCNHNNRVNRVETILKANNINPNIIQSRTPFRRIFAQEWKLNA
ncbi:hypothetical protein BDC45DRAFT_542353 [Circinella umbellata]|nr:hypothetical protein BDC45DRAFT_542353 [Circinella umbellata]